MNHMKRQKGMRLKGELPRPIGAQYVTVKKWRHAPDGMKGLRQSRNSAQLWMCLVVKVKSNSVKKKERKKETWNVRSMNQGKLEVVK